MSRISDTFERLRIAGRKGFVAYITAGDPDLATTADLVREFARRGVDIVELGVPFSDPLADGPVNQEAAERALKAQTTVEGILRMVGDLRADVEIPLVLFTYLNPILKYGMARCIERCEEAGIDGILLLDLPPEEGNGYRRLMAEHGLDTIFLVTPTTTEERMRLIAGYASGFIYCVSRTGVTGEQERLSASIGAMTATIRCHTVLPVAVGFGVSSPEQVGQAAGQADAVVVGSAIVKRVGAGLSVSEIGDFAESLMAPLRGL